MADERDRRIRDRAHAIWEAEGRPHGRDQEHWRQAAEEIDREFATEVTGGARTTPVAGMASDIFDTAQTSGQRRRVKAAEPAPDARTAAPKGRRGGPGAFDVDAMGTGSTQAPDASPAPGRKRRTVRSEGTKDDGAPPAERKVPQRHAAKSAEDAVARDPEPGTVQTGSAKGRRRTTASEGTKEDGAPPPPGTNATDASVTAAPLEESTTAMPPDNTGSGGVPDQPLQSDPMS